MNILVTGCSGFIASHLVPYLDSQGHAVCGIDLLEPADGLPLGRFTQGDIRKPQDMARAVEGVECVINLAAKHHDFGITEAEYFQTNEGGSQVVLDAMGDAGIGRYVFYSSVAVYGTKTVNPDESTPPAPELPYGASKLAGEKVAHRWAEASDQRSVVIMRPTIVFGERNLANMYSLIRQIDRGKYFQFGPGTNYKSVAYVGNLIRATHVAMGKMTPGVETFNYVDKPDQQVRETVAIIARALGKEPPKKSMPLSLGIAAGKVFDLAAWITGKNLRVSSARVKKLATTTQFEAKKIREHGFEQEFTIEQGLQRMVEWYKQGSQGGMVGGG